MACTAVGPGANACESIADAISTAIKQVTMGNNAFVLDARSLHTLERRVQVLNAISQELQAQATEFSVSSIDYFADQFRDILDVSNDPSCVIEASWRPQRWAVSEHVAHTDVNVSDVLTRHVNGAISTPTKLSAANVDLQSTFQAALARAAAGQWAPLSHFHGSATCTVFDCVIKSVADDGSEALKHAQLVYVRFTNQLTTTATFAAASVESSSDMRQSRIAFIDLIESMAATHMPAQRISKNRLVQWMSPARWSHTESSVLRLVISDAQDMADSAEWINAITRLQARGAEETDALQRKAAAEVAAALAAAEAEKALLESQSIKSEAIENVSTDATIVSPTEVAEMSDETISDLPSGEAVSAEMAAEAPAKAVYDEFFVDPNQTFEESDLKTAIQNAFFNFDGSAISQDSAIAQNKFHADIQSPSQDVNASSEVTVTMQSQPIIDNEALSLLMRRVQTATLRRELHSERLLVASEQKASDACLRAETAESRIAAMLSADEHLRQQHAQTLADIERRHAAQIKELNERLNNSYQVNGDAARVLAVAAQQTVLANAAELRAQNEADEKEMVVAHVKVVEQEKVVLQQQRDRLHSKLSQLLEWGKQHEVRADRAVAEAAREREESEAELNALHAAAMQMHTTATQHAQSAARAMGELEVAQEEHEKAIRTMTERATVAESQLEEAKAAAKLKQTEHAKRIKELQAKVSGEQAQSAVVAELTSTLTETTARADAQSKEIAALQTELKSMKSTSAAASKKANAVEKQLREELSAAQSAVEEQQKLVQQGQQKLQSARGHVEAAAQSAGRALAASERRAAAIRELNGAIASADSVNVAEVALPPARRKRSAIETKQPETDELVGEVTQLLSEVIAGEDNETVASGELEESEPVAAPKPRRRRVREVPASTEQVESASPDAEVEEQPLVKAKPAAKKTVKRAAEAEAEPSAAPKRGRPTKKAPVVEDEEDAEHEKELILKAAFGRGKENAAISLTNKAAAPQLAVIAKLAVADAAKTSTSPTHSVHSVASAAQKRGGFMVTPSVAPLVPAPMTTLSQASQSSFRSFASNVSAPATKPGRELFASFLNGMKVPKLRVPGAM